MRIGCKLAKPICRHSVCGQPGTHPRRRRRGIATVEVAVMLPLLLLVLGVIIELGMVARTRQTVHQAARAGAWRAAEGAVLSDINDHVTASAASLAPDALTVTCEYRPYDPDTGTWGDWTALTDGGPNNNAAISGDRVQVTVGYEHALAMGGLLTMATGDGDSGTVTIACAVAARRE